MVNTGFPSRACQTCRRRRVKCDLRRPGCVRCEKFGQPCSGYRDLDQPRLIFRIQTPSSYDGPKTRKSYPWSSPNRDEQTDTGASKVSKASYTRACSMRYSAEGLENLNTLPRSSAWKLSSFHRLIEPWDMHVMPLIVSQFSFPKRGGGRVYGSLELFPELLRRAEKGSVLYLTCHAVGYVYLANKMQSSSLVLSHRDWYGKALRALGQALCDPNLQKQDSTFLAVWLLCLYELILGTPLEEGSRKGPLNWDTHTRALVALLRVRGRRQFSSKRGCQLFQLAYHTIQVQLLQTGQSPPPEASEWFDVIQSSVNPEEVIFLPSFLYLHKAAEICSKIRPLIDNGSREQKLFAINEITQACNKLESSMKDHFGDVVTCPSVSSAAKLTAATGLSPLPYLRIRNYIDALFLRVHYSILELLFHTAKFVNNSGVQHEQIAYLRRVSVKQSQARADRILMTLPRLLPKPSDRPTGDGEICLTTWANALSLMWPVRLIASSPVVKEEQTTTAKSALFRIGYEVGIMQAVGSYYTTLPTYETL